MTFSNKLVASQVIKESGVQFGTSGARGLVTQFTHDVCAAFTYAFVDSMRANFVFNKVAIAIDNRPSSPEIAQACISALKSLGIETVFYGVIPTPALAYKAMQDEMPCIMVTGSHIPFDRNGLKFYRPDGEISKQDELAITSSEVKFSPVVKMPELVTDSSAAETYCKRYSSLFDSDFLQGKRIGIYEHSSAGRDLYASLFSSFGADVISLERTDTFVPIDTEAVSEADKQKAREWSSDLQLDFIFSTDGDGDRPLVANENGEWLRGDILGLLCSKALKVDALAVPVSCNTVIAQSPDFELVKQTRIGSPYVIAEFSELAKQYKNVAGFEANGGYLLGSDVEVNGKTLKSLPTRDAVLPALMLLSAAKYSSIECLVAELPQRFAYSDRIQNFATEASLELVERGERDPKALLIDLGFKKPQIMSVNNTDGLRITLYNSDIVHLRPSGNAPELRCYAEADDLNRAKDIVDLTLSAAVRASRLAEIQV